jgi:hypothetical protein
VLWDVPSKKQLGDPLTGDTGRDDPTVTGLAFTADGATLASAGLHGTVRLWQHTLWGDYDHLQQEVCRLVGGGLSRDEWGAIVPDLRYHQSCPSAAPPQSRAERTPTVVG